MNKRQVDFDIAVRPFAQNIDPRMVLKFLKDSHPFEDGWELLSTEVAQIGGGDLFMAYTFVRYEYDAVSTKVK